MALSGHAKVMGVVCTVRQYAAREGEHARRCIPGWVKQHTGGDQQWLAATLGHLSLCKLPALEAHKVCMNRGNSNVTCCNVPGGTGVQAQSALTADGVGRPAATQHSRQSLPSIGAGSSMASSGQQGQQIMQAVDSTPRRVTWAPDSQGSGDLAHPPRGKPCSISGSAARPSTTSRSTDPC